MSAFEQKFDFGAFCKTALRDAAETVTVGYTLMMLLLGALVHWAGLGSISQGHILGFGFQLSAVFFLAFVGLFRSIKAVPAFSSTVYRLFHFVLSAAMLYVSFFVVWPGLAVGLSEMKEDTSGVVNFTFIIFAYVLFLASYFAVIGIRAAVRAHNAKVERERAEYESMLARRKNQEKKNG